MQPSSVDLGLHGPQETVPRLAATHQQCHKVSGFEKLTTGPIELLSSKNITTIGYHSDVDTPMLLY